MPAPPEAPGDHSGPAPEVAFVLGGGGVLGSCEVGMLRALLERAVVPDLVVGTSIGAINGAVLAATPDLSAVERLHGMWTSMSGGEVFGSALARVGTLARTRTHLHDNRALRGLLRAEFGAMRIEDLAVPFQCVAASIERAAKHWFTRGPLVEALLATSAVPGLLPPVQIDGEHYLDGGLVDSIPVGRAVALGARVVYVLHVGRIENPLEPPRRPWDVATVAFEIARRHRFAEDMAAVPAGITVHVLPSGEPPPRYNELAALRYRSTTRAGDRIAAAYEATSAYLDGLARRDAAPGGESPAGQASGGG